MPLIRKLPTTLKAVKDPWVDVRGYASINAAITAIGSTQTTLVVPNAQTLTANLIIPSTLKLQILKGGSIVKASTYTLTINGPFEAGLYQIFSGFDTGVTFGAGSVAEVRPEWWTENATPGTTDMTTALTAALATGKNVQLNGCIYGTTGGHRIATDGQHIYGAGREKTTIKKLSGTNYVIDTNHAQNWIGLSGITFDGNNLDGSQIIWRGHYSTIRDIWIKGQGGTSYGIYISGVNISSFENIDFADGNYGGILIDQSVDTYTPTPNYGCLYSTFNGISSGTFSASALNINGSLAANLTFTNFYFEHNTLGVASIYIRGSNIYNITFYDLQSEYSVLTTPLVDITDAVVYNIHFIGGKISANAANTQPIFHFKGIQNVSVQNMLFYDNFSAAGRNIINLEAVTNGRFEGNVFSCLNDFDFIECIGTGNSYITEKNNTRRDYTLHPGIGTNIWYYVDHLVIENSQFKQSFLVSPNKNVNISMANNVHSQNTVGQITIADDGYYDIFGNGGITNPLANFIGLISIHAGAISATSINNFALFWAQTSATTLTQLNVPIAVASNVEIVNVADNTVAALATTTDGKLGVQIGGGNATTRYIRIYNRTGASVNIRVHVDKYEE